MGCTPSILNHHHHHSSATTNNNNHRHGPSEDAEGAPPDSPGNMTTGSSSSPRNWFQKVKDKDKSVKPKSPAPQAVQNLGIPAGLTLPPVQNYSAKVLLAFGKDDFQSEAFWLACEKLGYECNLARTKESVLDAFQTKNHDIIVIDNRNPKFIDAESICKALRDLKSTQFTVIVGVVRRSTIEKEDSSIEPMLNMGFNRVCVETSCLSQCMNELLQLYKSDVEPRVQLATVQALYVALDKSTDLVHITDHNLNIQYINRSSERFLGYSIKDMMGKPLLDANSVENKDLMVQQLQRGREWEGHISWKRKVGDPITLSGRVIPAAIPGRTPTHFIFIHELPYSTHERRMPSAHIPKNPELPKSQSSRKGSVDIKSISSDGLRRQSIAKLHNLQIEAPITKVIALITSVQENASLEDSQTLDKTFIYNDEHTQGVKLDCKRTRKAFLLATFASSISLALIPRHILNQLLLPEDDSKASFQKFREQIGHSVVDILRTTELYSPQLKDDKGKPGDPITSDLMGALLSKIDGSNSGSTLQAIARRSSSDSGSVTKMGLSRTTIRATQHMSNQLRELLDTSLLWDFDIFKLEELSSKRPLVFLGMNLMNHFDVASSLGIEESVIHNWLTIIEINYNSKNTYHTSTHAADVMQATAGFLERECLKQILDPMDEAICLIAAAAHDVDHPGKSSAFLSNSGHELAILYNDLCVLESHHAALAFKLTMSDERVNIFKSLERDVYKAVRQSVIDMILATEMTKHFEHLAKFVNVFSIKKEDDSPEGGRNSPDTGILTAPENIALIKRMLIKCADVSNPTRPVKMCVEWAIRIAEEYFNQTDEEKANNLPVVMPLFDRATCSIPKSQIGFMDFIINDMFETWEAFIEMPELLQNAEYNYKFWKEKESVGLHQIKDIIMNQQALRNEKTD